MNELKFKTINLGGIKAKNGKFCCRVIHNGIVTREMMATDMAKKMNLSTVEARFFLENVLAYILKSVEEGRSLQLGPLVLQLALRGTVDGANGQYPADGEGPILVLRAGKELKESLAKLKPVNITAENTGQPHIQRLLDADWETQFKISGEGTVYVSGVGLSTDSKRDDEGVFLEDSKGNVIARGKIIKSTLTTLDAKFEDEIDDGVYYFVVRTRSGDKDRQLTYKTRHKVTVQKKL